MIRVAFCNDDLYVAGELESILTDFCKQEGLYASMDVVAGVKELECVLSNEKVFDVIFLNIVTETETEIAVRMIRERQQRTLIIFMTERQRVTSPLLVREGFALLQNPIEKQKFLSVFLQAYRRTEEDDQYFVFKYRTSEEKILVCDILYFESNARKIVIHLKNGTGKSFNGVLSDVERKVAESGHPFLRIHQSYLVGYYSILKRTRKSVELVDHTVLPISERRAEQFGMDYRALIEKEICI
ncbi:MAG: LytR/AlgR family response regulator transcription factor [Acetatifactor sp.]